MSPGHRPRGGRSRAEAAFVRYVSMLEREIEPDPLFRRRLRGRVLNVAVAAREGAADPHELHDSHAARRVRRRGGSHVGGRLLRGALSACLILSVGVTTTLAASAASVPGDPLHLIKRALESVRMHLLPAELDDELVEHERAARIQELGGGRQVVAITRLADQPPHRLRLGIHDAIGATDDAAQNSPRGARATPASGGTGLPDEHGQRGREEHLRRAVPAIGPAERRETGGPNARGPAPSPGQPALAASTAAPRPTPSAVVGTGASDGESSSPSSSPGMPEDAGDARDHRSMPPTAASPATEAGSNGGRPSASPP